MATGLFKSIALAVCCTVSLGAHAVSSITVNGRADGALAAPAPIAETDVENGPAMARTIVSVAEESPGAWKYAATADIGTPKLQVFASLDNSSGGDLGNVELPLLISNASLRDTITITAPSADPYIVTAEMIIDGVMQGLGSNARVNALLTMTPAGKLSLTGNKSYTGNLPAVNDVLTVERQYTGDAVFDLTSSLFFSVTQVDAGASILADFSNTALVKLSLRTVAGDPIENFTLTSESGSFGVAPVPVPAALPLLLSAVVTLGWRGSRRHRGGRRVC